VEAHPKAAAHRATPHSGVGKHAEDPNALPAFGPALSARRLERRHIRAARGGEAEEGEEEKGAHRGWR